MSDLTDKPFGLWKVIRFGGRTKWHQALWLCRCVCGVERNVPEYDLVNDKSTSFGHDRSFKHGAAKRRNLTREYKAWKSAKARVSNPGLDQAKDYIGRGISMCQPWRKSFAKFLAYMGPCPPGMTLERIDNNGNYEPGNCRWVTRKEQSSNTRRNRYITFDGRTHTQAQWSRELGIDHKTLAKRLKAGWPLEKALRTHHAKTNPA